MQSAPNRFLSRRGPPHIATLIILCSLSSLSMTVILPSLPSMADHFQADYRLLQLSVALYLAMNAVVQIFVGPISDTFGRRPVIIGGLVLFLLATLGCIYAPNASVFLAFRMAQAVIATAIVLSRAAVRDIFDSDKAASMIGYVTMGMAVVPMVGPAIGGALEGLFGWTASFWLLAALTLLTWAITHFDFAETAHKSGKSLMAQFREYPELFRSPRFWGYSMSSGLASGAFFAYLGGAPFVGTEIYGLSPAALGVFFATPSLGYAVGNFLSGRYSVRIGINRMVLWGNWIVGAGVAASLALALLGLDSKWSFFLLMIPVGVGNGMAIPNATAGALSVRPHLAGSASGLSGAIMLALGAALSAFAGWLLGPGSTAAPLLIVMLASAILGLATIRAVIRRERSLGL